jgi:putative acetyltransferase
MIHVRPETAADAPVIHEVTREAFLHAAHTDHTEQFIVDALRNAGALAVSLVAEREGAVVGHVALSAVEVGDGGVGQGWFGLGPISVLPAHQRQGVGVALMLAALQALRDRGAAGCVILGDPAYYGRFGFRPAAPLVLPEVPQEFFQALPLAADLPSGVVRYHAAFAATDPSEPRV